MTAPYAPLGCSNAGKTIPHCGRLQEKTVKSTLLRAFVLGAGLVAVPALAQDSETFGVQTTVVPFCSEMTISSVPMNLGSLTGAEGQLVNDFGGATESERELAASFYCNAPSTVTLTAGPLQNSGVPIVSDSTSFTNRVDYVATLLWDDVQGNDSSVESAGQQIDVAQANIGPMKIKLSDPTVANNKRPVAGDYAGQIHLTVALAQ